MLLFFLGGLRLSFARILPRDHIANQKEIFPQGCFLVNGIVESDPEAKGGKAEFILKILKINNARFSGNVLVRDFGRRSTVYGDEIILKGKFLRPRQFHSKGNFDYATYLRRKGIYGFLNASKEDDFRIIADGKGNILKAAAIKIKQKIQRGFNEYLPQTYAALLSTMLLGDRRGLARELSDVFVKTGTAHILAISGMNIAITAFILLVFLKVMRVPAKPRYILTIAFIVFYNFITGAQPSVTRAVIMGSVLLAGLLLEREVNIYNSLAFSALLILSYNPYQLWDVGFQLSFASVLGIVYLAPKIEKVLPWRNFIVKSACVSLSAWLVTFLPVVYYFKIISPVTILANLIIVPLVTLMMITGFIFMLSLFISPNLAPIFGLTCGLTGFLMVASAKALSLLPFAYFYL